MIDDKADAALAVRGVAALDVMARIWKTRRATKSANQAHKLLEIGLWVREEATSLGDFSMRAFKAYTLPYMLQAPR